MAIYTARVRRDGEWWLVSVDEVEGLTTKVRLLEQVPMAVREQLAHIPGEFSDPEDAIVMVFPEDDSQCVLHVKDLSERVRKLQHEEQRAMRQAVRELSLQGLTFRDIGEILGVDFKRAMQLAK